MVPRRGPCWGAFLALFLSVISPAPPAHGQAGPPTAPAEARLTVLVPADAAISFFGKPTTQKGTERLFITPVLQPGKEYYYDITARWAKEGRGVEETRRVWVTAGSRVKVKLLVPALVGSGKKLTEEEIRKIGKEAYVYGYPLVTMEMTRRVMTNTTEPKGNHARWGNSTMRSDLSGRFVPRRHRSQRRHALLHRLVGRLQGALLIESARRRRSLLPHADAGCLDHRVPGARQTDHRHQGEDVCHYGSELERRPAQGRHQVPIAHGPGLDPWPHLLHGHPGRLQGRACPPGQVFPGAAKHYGKPYTPPKGTVDPNIDMKTPVRDQVDKMDAGTYFKLMAALMKDNPPAKEDAPMVAKMAKIGLVPGQDFDISKLDPAMAKALAGVPKAGIEAITAEFKTGPTKINGWEILTKTGIYGTDYANRALVTAIGLGANRPQDAIYPTSIMDGDGKPYSGAHKYVMHFDKGQTPPADGFWSLTMYDAKFFFVANRLNKYTVSPRNALKYNPDGSLDIYLQKESPGSGQGVQLAAGAEG